MTAVVVRCRPLKPIDQWHTGAAKGGHHAKNKSRAGGEKGSDRQQARINRDRRDCRLSRQRRQRPQGPDAHGGDEQAEAAADARQEHAFRQQLTDDAPAPRAERHAQRQFGASRAASRQQQRRDVRARHQQHERDGRLDRQEGSRGPSIQHVAKRPRAHAPLAAGDRPEIGLRLIDADAWPQPADHVVQTSLVFGARLERPHRPPIVDAVVGIDEARRHHAYDGHERTIQANLAADDRRIRVVPPGPQTMADDDDGSGRAEARIVVCKNPPEQRTDTQCRDGPGVEQMAVDSFRWRAALGAEIAGSSERHAERHEGAAPLAPGKIIAKRNAADLPGIRQGERAQDKQAIRVGQRQWQHPERVEHAERRRVGAEAERQRHGGHEGKRAALREDAKPVRHVLAEIVCPRHPPLIAAVLLEHGDVAERPPRRPARIVERHAARDVLGDEEVEMEGQLARDLGIDGVLPDQGPEALVRDAKETGDGHVRLRSSGPFQYQSHCGREAIPAGELALQLLAALARQRVELRAPAKVRLLPVGDDPALVLEAVERRVERSLLDRQHLVGELLDALGDRPTMKRVARDGLEDEEVERPLEQI